jgi:hypothetical protein
VSQKSAKTEDDDSDGAGCLVIIGAIIVAICIGKITQEVYGWLTLGGACIVIGLWSMVIDARRK